MHEGTKLHGNAFAMLGLNQIKRKKRVNKFKKGESTSFCFIEKVFIFGPKLITLT